MEQVVTSADGVGSDWSGAPAAPRADTAATVPPPRPAPALLPGAVRAVLEPVTGGAADVVTEAQRRTRRLAGAHYENFSVVSLLLPRHLRQDFCNVYAFCRVADDLGDELADPAASSEALATLRRQTLACHGGVAETMLFAALRQTIERHDIPAEPFLDLIEAFEQDQRVTRYESFSDVVEYCRRSANPVGRLVLYLCGYRDAERQRLSDETCTALQLANFWQDVRRDLLDRNRVYLPAQDMRQFGVSESDLSDGIGAGRCSGAYARLVEFEVDRTAKMFDDGAALLPMLDARVRGQVALYGKGGRLVLEAIRAQGYDTLASRPALGKWRKGRLVLSALAARLLSRRARRRESAGRVPA